MADKPRTSSKIPLQADDPEDHEQAGNENRATDNTSRQTSTHAKDCRKNADEFLLVVVGKSGTGKSSLCNQIVGDELSLRFRVGTGLSTCTIKDQEERITRYGRKFCLLDTFDDEDGNMVTLTNSLKRRLAKFNNKVFFLFCVRYDARYAVEEHSVYQNLKAAWKDTEDLTNRLIVTFTHSDMMSYNTSQEEDQQIETIRHDADKRPMYGSLDKVSDISGPGNYEREVDGKKSAKEIKLQEMINLKLPQFNHLIKDAKETFFFNNQVKDDDQAQALINFVTNYTPPLRPVMVNVSCHNTSPTKSCCCPLF